MTRTAWEAQTTEETEGQVPDRSREDGTVRSHVRRLVPTRIFARAPVSAGAMATEDERRSLPESRSASTTTVVGRRPDGPDRDRQDGSTSTLTRPRTTTPVIAPPARSTAPLPSPAVAPASLATVTRRASLLATLALVLGVVALAGVLTGTLVKAGVIVGGGALLIALGGLSATISGRRTGKFDALLGSAFAAAAVVIGVLALTGRLSWLNTDLDQVARLRDWLHSQLSWL